MAKRKHLSLARTHPPPVAVTAPAFSAASAALPAKVKLVAFATSALATAALPTAASAKEDALAAWAAALLYWQQPLNQQQLRQQESHWKSSLLRFGS